MPKSYQGGGKTISELQSTRRYCHLRQYDTIVLSFFMCTLGKVTEIVQMARYNYFKTNVIKVKKVREYILWE